MGKKTAAKEALKASCSGNKKLSENNDKQDDDIDDIEKNRQEEQEEQQSPTLQFGEHFSL